MFDGYPIGKTFGSIGCGGEHYSPRKPELITTKVHEEWLNSNGGLERLVVYGHPDTIYKIFNDLSEPELPDGVITAATQSAHDSEEE